MRINNHPILGEEAKRELVRVEVDGKEILAYAGEPIAAALLANGLKVFRYTNKKHEPRGLFCGIGQCTDCIMEVDGVPNIRTCITPIVAGMKIKTQKGCGEWGRLHE